jgi:hypothetical protein
MWAVLKIAQIFNFHFKLHNSRIYYIVLTLFKHLKRAEATMGRGLGSSEEVWQRLNSCGLQYTCAWKQC